MTNTLRLEIKQSPYTSYKYFWKRDKNVILKCLYQEKYNAGLGSEITRVITQKTTSQ
jgi:hypothetical protein